MAARSVADARAGDEAVDADHLGAFFGGGSHGEHAARAAADDENIGVDGLGDVLFGDFRRLAEPVAVVFGGFLLRDHFDGDFPLGLRNAFGGGLTNGL